MLGALPIRQLVLNSGAPAKNLAKCFSVMTFNVLAQCYTRSEVPFAIHIHVWPMHGCMCVILDMVSCRVLALTPSAGDCQYSHVRYVSVSRLCQIYPSVNPKAALKWKNRGPKVCCPCKQLDIKFNMYL